MQLVLQGAAMHAQAPRGRGDVAAVFVQHLLNVFPLEPNDRRPLLADRYMDVAVPLRECLEDLVGIGGLAEVMHGAQFDGLDRGRDARITGEHDSARMSIEFLEPFDQRQTGIARHLEVEHHELRQFPLRDLVRARRVVRRAHRVAASGERRGQHRAKRGVVVDHQQAR